MPAAALNVPILARRLRTTLPKPSNPTLRVLREGGVIADGFDAELDELRGIQTNCGDFLLALEARERARTGIDKLKVEYNRVHGFYIEVSQAQSVNVPDDYRRRQTLKNAERYITPELKSLRGQGAVGQRARAGAREVSSTNSCSISSRRSSRNCNASPPRSPNSTCSPLLPNAPPR